MAVAERVGETFCAKIVICRANIQGKNNPKTVTHNR